MTPFNNGVNPEIAPPSLQQNPQATQTTEHTAPAGGDAIMTLFKKRREPQVFDLYSGYRQRRTNIILVICIFGLSAVAFQEEIARTLEKRAEYRAVETEQNFRASSIKRDLRVLEKRAEMELRLMEVEGKLADARFKSGCSPMTPAKNEADAWAMLTEDAIAVDSAHGAPLAKGTKVCFYTGETGVVIDNQGTIGDVKRTGNRELIDQFFQGRDRVKPHVAMPSQKEN